MSDKMEKEFYVVPLLREGGWVSTYRFNRPDYMERSSETRMGFFRHAASEDNVEQFEELLQMPEPDMELNAASLAAKLCNIRCLELALKYGHSGTDPDCLIAAVEGGSLACVIHLLQNCNATVTEHVVVAAAMAGKFVCVEHIAPILQNSANEFGSNRLENKFGPPPFGEHARQWMPGVCDHMALLGNAAALLTLVQGKCGGHMDDKTLLAAVKGGSPKCVEYLLDVRHSGAGAKIRPTEEVVNLALRCGNPECLTAVFQAYSVDQEVARRANTIANVWNKGSLEEAARSGFVDTIEFALTHGARWYPQVPAIAAENGRAAILKLGKALGLPLLGMTPLGAIKGRNLECLRYAVEFACEHVPASAMVFAVATGYLDGVRYLREAGFPLWTARDRIDAEGLYALRQLLKPYLEDLTGRAALPAPQLGPHAAPRFAGPHAPGFPGVGAPAGFAGFGGQGFAGAAGPGFAGGPYGHAPPMQPNAADVNLPGMPPGHAQGVHVHPPHGAHVNHVVVPAVHILGPPHSMQHAHAHPPPHGPHMLGMHGHVQPPGHGAQWIGMPGHALPPAHGAHVNNMHGMPGPALPPAHVNNMHGLHGHAHPLPHGPHVNAMYVQYGMHGHAQQGQAPLGAAVLAGILGDVMPENVLGVFMDNIGNMFQDESPVTYGSGPIHPLDATWKIVADKSRAIDRQPKTRAFGKVQWPPERMEEDKRTAFLEYVAILRFAACQGAPLTQHSSQLLTKQRECTLAALRGFHRVRNASGARVQLPRDITDKMFMALDLEIKECFKYPKHRSSKRKFSG